MKKQLEIFRRETEHLRTNPNVRGIMLTGSVARGTASELSDLDMVVLCDKDEFVSKYVNGILVELHSHTFETMWERLGNNSMEVYHYLDSKIVWDDGSLGKLMCYAQQLYVNYKVSAKEKQMIQYWLSSVNIKLNAALQDGNAELISYIISTNLWKVLEGMWAVNSKPMPPSSLAFDRQKNLVKVPYKNWFMDLLKKDTISRGTAMYQVIAWIVSRLQEDT